MQARVMAEMNPLRDQITELRLGRAQAQPVTDMFRKILPWIVAAALAIKFIPMGG